jgi:hypothetical protein
MPHVSLPIDKNGMVIEVRVGLKAATLAALVASAMPVPPPIQVRGLVDPGADVTALSKSLVKRLAIEPHGKASNQTASDVVEVSTYRVSLTITGPDNSMLVRPDLLVTELASNLPEIDVLIGMDVLAECLLILDGPGRRFTLAF